MTELQRTSVFPQEECLARVVWAAHILFYLTGNRKHKPYEAENNMEFGGNTDESSDIETDYETEKNEVLSGPRDSVRQKFLDCIAQLLSPCKGWDGVTATAIREGEDGVEVDIARNDGFVSNGNCSENDITGYCKMLEEYLEGRCEAGTDMNSNASLLTEFELKAIEYTSGRIDYWVEKIRVTLKIDEKNSDWSSQPWVGQEAAIKTWKTMLDQIVQFDANTEPVKSRPLIVQQAYYCLKSTTQVRQLLSDSFGTEAGLKLWSKLNFIARPLVDCRLLRSIAAREPQLRNCKISLVRSNLKTTLLAKYVVDIFEAWEQLGLGSTPESVSHKLHPFSHYFEEACAKTFSLHAEMQLVTHYEERCALQPTLDYFGCSKKTCLLCETFLGALPSPIATRGRHGICYPAWGIPNSNSGAVETAVDQLEKSLVNLIKESLDDLMHPHHGIIAENIMQSGMVSDFSNLTIEERQQREQEVRLFKDEQMTKHNVFHKRAGHPSEWDTPSNCDISN